MTRSRSRSIKQKFTDAELKDHQATTAREAYGVEENNHLALKDWPVSRTIKRAPRFGAFVPPCFGSLIDSGYCDPEPVPEATRWTDGPDRPLLDLRLAIEQAAEAAELGADGSERDYWEVIKTAWSSVNGTRPILSQGILYFYESSVGYWRPFSPAILNSLIWILVDGLQGTKLSARKVYSLLRHASLDGLIELELEDPFEDETPGVLMLTSLAPSRSPEYAPKQLRIHVPTADGLVEYHCPDADDRKRHTFAKEGSKLAELVPVSDECPSVEPWERYLSSLFKGDPDADSKISVLEEFLGASMCGLATRYAKTLILEGSGANGKSLFLEVVRRLLFRPDQVCVSTPATWDKFGLRDLDGPLINLVSELDETNVFKSAAFKSAVTGDMLRGEHKGGASFKFKPRAGHLFSCNAIPNTVDQSLGFRRRFIILGFFRNFSKLAEHRFEDEILAPLQDVAHLIRGRLVWKAASLMNRGKYCEVKSSTRAIEEWTTASDVVQDYAASAIEPAIVDAFNEYPFVRGRAKPSELYVDFVAFARNTGRSPMSSRKFYKRLESVGVLRHRTMYNGTRCFDCVARPVPEWTEGFLDPNEAR